MGIGCCNPLTLRPSDILDYKAGPGWGGLDFGQLGREGMVINLTYVSLFSNSTSHCHVLILIFTLLMFFEIMIGKLNVYSVTETEDSFTCNWAISIHYYMLYIDCIVGKKALHVEWKLSQVSFAAISALKGGGGCNQITCRLLYSCKYYLVLHLLLVLNLCKHCILIFFAFMFKEPGDGIIQAIMCVRDLWTAAGCSKLRKVLAFALTWYVMKKTKATSGGLHITFVSWHFIEGFHLLMVYTDALILQF